jgi:hypothetical protein
MKKLIIIMFSLSIIHGCVPFKGERTSKIELNILGSTWKSETTCKGAYTQPKEEVAP